MYKEWGDGKADPSVFNPTQLDPDQWVTASKAAGAKYLVMVAKHHDGFCLWPSRHTDYSVKRSPWKNGKGDLVREVEQACRKHGLKFGVYLSPWDRHEPSYKDNAAYDNYYSRQLEELITGYGEIIELWLDGAGSEGHVYDFERYVKLLRTYQPNACIFADTGFVPWGDIRWVGNEEGFAREEEWNVVDRLGYLRWRPVEADTPLRKRHWFWHPNDEKSLNSLTELLDIYHKTVGRGAQLVLGLSPDNRGLLPESDVARLREFGEAIQQTYSRNLALGAMQASSRINNARSAVDDDPDTTWMANPGARSEEIVLRFPSRVSVDRAVIMEWLPEGQTIQKYDLQIMEGDQYRTVARGTSIGHKKMELFPRVTTRAVKLRLLSCSGRPAIREFQLYDGTAANPK
jgi:alpha-L-fucosidase